jgi:hypothetical protein
MSATTQHGARTICCTVRLSATSVLARAPLTLSATVETEPLRDLRGLDLQLLDGEGARLASLPIARFDGRIAATDEVVLYAPAAAGPTLWSLWAPAQTLAGVAYDEVRVPVAFTVEPHPIRANAWGLPSAPLAGSPVRVRVGAKGASEAALAGRPFEVLDADGAVAAAGRFGGERMAGSDGLVDAEVELPTPAAPGIARWTLAVPGFDHPLPHAPTSHAFSVRTVAPPDRAVTVTAIDFATRQPVAGARVVLHPFRGVTDASGVATVHVTGGRHRLFVTANGYEVRAEDLDVDGDLAFEAELVVVVEPDAGDHYV